jgi:hypothetical protein
VLPLTSKDPRIYTYAKFVKIGEEEKEKRQRRKDAIDSRNRKRIRKHIYIKPTT